MFSLFKKKNVLLHNNYILRFDPGNYHLGIKIKYINFLT